VAPPRSRLTPFTDTLNKTRPQAGQGHTTSADDQPDFHPERASPQGDQRLRTAWVGPIQMHNSGPTPARRSHNTTNCGRRPVARLGLPGRAQAWWCGPSSVTMLLVP
jgi:hypothetical protein